MSFANPATFAVLKDAKQGETFEITTGKNDKDYITWTSATKIAGSATAVGQGPATPRAAAWVPDADRQRLIVKQSSLTAALKFAELRGDEVTFDTIIESADEFVKYVYDVPELESADAGAD